MKQFALIISILILITISGMDSPAQLTGGWFIQQNPTNNILNDVKFFDINNGLIVGVQGTILKTTNSGNNWNIIKSGTTRNLNSISLTHSSIVYIAGDSGIILKSTDFGSSWISLQSKTFKNLNAIAFNSSDIGFCVGKNGTLLKTINSGQNWIETFLDTLAQFSSISFINENFIWVIGERDSIFPLDFPILIKSSNLGLNWSEQPIDIYEGTSIFFLDTLDGYVFKCPTLLNDGIQKTTNGGLSWECVWAGFLSPEKVFFINQMTGYSVGNSSASYSICKTTNAGHDWNFSSAPGNFLYLNSIHFVNSETGWTVGEVISSVGNAFILKTTNGGGTLTNIITTSGEVPSEFSLHQNYPNPFNPSTKISFDIPVTSFPILSVYNSEGRKIETLYDGNLNAGCYEVSFDGSNYPSGVYYYKLESNGNSISKKMLLLK